MSVPQITTHTQSSSADAPPAAPTAPEHSHGDPSLALLSHSSGDAGVADVNSTFNKNNFSTLSTEGDLKADIETAFSTSDFKYQGRFACATSLPQAPNPGLSIDGVGLIGLPLSARDAAVIKETAAQAPYGKGAETLIDKQVRDTWEIGSQRVRFTNPAWDSFIDNVVVSDVWRSLGVAPYRSPPRCELYKLLLYETGSHFLPHQDTAKVNGMFATLIIVLPSQYTGGEVHVSHGSSSEVFDLSSSSDFTTSVLAWYTDVIHSVKPITSGYRLALSYNLIHTTTGVLIPRPPSCDTMSDVRRIFRRWSQGDYPNARDVVVYMLAHQYSQFELSQCALKGEDAHLVSLLKDAAETAGIVLCLANVELYVAGSADDYGGGYYKRGRYGYDSYGGDMPEMVEEHTRTLSLENVVTLDGEDFCSLEIESGDLIPEDAFEDLSPDKTEYEGYQGNAAGDVQHWYHLTGLVLFLAENQDRLLLTAQGPTYALQKLKQATDQPTTDNKAMVEFLLHRIKNPYGQYFSYSGPTSSDEITRVLVDLSMRWNDVQMWKSVAGVSLEAIAKDTPRLLAARKRFGSDNVNDVLGQAVESIGQLKSKPAFIEALRAEAPDGEGQVVVDWCSLQSEKAFRTLKPPGVSDAETLLQAILQRGIHFTSEVIMPQLARFDSTYDFWTAFIPMLHRHRDRVIGPIPGDKTDPMGSSHPLASIYSDVIAASLRAAMLQWNSAPPAHSLWGQPVSTVATRVVPLVSLCFDVGRVELCSELLSAIAQTGQASHSVFAGVVIPIVPELCTSLRQKGLDVCSPIFKKFLRLAIGIYMRDILGAKPEVPKVFPLRKVGCGCVDCQELDDFLVSPTVQVKFFRAVQSRRSHLEGRLLGVRDHVKFHTERRGSPHSLVMIKSINHLQIADWEKRQLKASAFLNSIGSNNVRLSLLGDQFPVVQRALTGSHAIRSILMFDDYSTTSDNPVSSQATASTAPSQGVFAVGSTVARATGHVRPKVAPAMPSSSSSQPNPVSGQKRRKGVSSGDVIDLTL